MRNVQALPQTGFAPTNDAIASHLREQAEIVEQGGHGNLRTIVMLYETHEGQIARQVCGGPCDLARMIGLIHIAGIRESI